jgi:purine-binding chemotaxis protein CheW
MKQEFDREPMLEMFIFTVRNLLDQLDQAVVANGKPSLEQSSVNNIQKIMQMIKGSSGMMMYTNISSLAHSAEDLFSFVYACDAAVDFDKLADIVLKAADFIKMEINKLENHQASDGDAAVLITAIEHFLADIKTVNQAKETSEDLQTYQADIYFEDDCEMENVRAFSVIHNLEQIAQEIAYLPDDIDSSEASKDIQQNGFHICFKSIQSVDALHEFFEKTPFLKEFQLHHETAKPQNKIKQIVLENPLPVMEAARATEQQSSRQSGKIQTAVNGGNPDKGVEHMAAVEVKHEDTQKGKFLTFSVGNEYYGIAIQYVTEIIGGIQAITEVPELPAYVKGIINLRGTIIPVMDIRLRFKKEPKAYNDRTCIVVVNIKDIFIGLIVDAVSEVLTIADQEIVAPPAGHKSFQNRYIKGIGKVGKEVKLLLDCNKLINDEEFESLTNIQ